MEMPTQRTGEDPNARLQISLAFTQSLFVFSVVFLSVVLLAMATLRGRLLHNFFNLSLCNLAIGGIIFSLLIRPGTIHEELSSAALTTGYCGFYLTFLDVETIFIPCVLITMTTERLIAIKEPENYSKRFKTPTKITLAAIPWLWGIGFGLIRNYAMADGVIAHYGTLPDDEYYNSHTHLSAVGCMIVFYDGNDHGFEIFGKIFATSIPVTLLGCGSVLLLVMFCQNKRAAHTEMDVDRPVVYPSSVIYCMILNLIMIIILVTDALTLTFVASWANPHWKICSLELLVAILALTSLSDIRRTLTTVCCCRGNQEDEDYLIPVTTTDSENA